MYFPIIFLAILNQILTSQRYSLQLPHHLQKKYQIKCVSGTENEFQTFVAINGLNLKKELIILFSNPQKNHQHRDGCLDLFRDGVSINHQNIDTLYKYGKWCGEDYGGFDNSCKDACLQNPFVPSEECIKCNPPSDYVDEQCMYHDFCMERFQRFHIGNGRYRSDEFECLCGNKYLGKSIPNSLRLSHKHNVSPSTEIIKVQTFIIFRANCDDFQCSFNGGLINDVFTDREMTCTCTYKNCLSSSGAQKHQHFRKIKHQTICPYEQQCTSVSECEQLHNQENDPDEGI